MRVAVVGPAHPLKGGVAQHTTELATRLRTAGHDTLLVYWRRQYPNRLYPGEQFVTTPELPAFRPTERTLSWDRPDTWWRAGRRLAEFDLVVIAHVTAIQAIPYRTLLAGIGDRAKTVVICHNVLPHERRPIDRPLARTLLRAADTVVVHSGPERDLAGTLTDRPVRVAVMPPHLPTSFEAAANSGEHRTLLFFGFVRPYKGLDVLLRAMAKGPPDVRLRVAGEFWGSMGPTQQLCAELSLEDRVEIQPGYVAAADAPKLFADVDALVLPYRQATGSQAVWSAFAMGVPVIATRAGQLAASIRDGVDGLLADPGDVESLASAINRFYQPGVPERLRAKVRPVDPAPVWADYLRTLEVL